MASSNIVNKSGLVPSSFAGSAGGGGSVINSVVTVPNAGFTATTDVNGNVTLGSTFLQSPNCCMANGTEHNPVLNNTLTSWFFDTLPYNSNGSFTLIQPISTYFNGIQLSTAGTYLISFTVALYNTTNSFTGSIINAISNNVGNLNCCNPVIVTNVQNDICQLYASLIYQATANEYINLFCFTANDNNSTFVQWNDTFCPTVTNVVIERLL